MKYIGTIKNIKGEVIEVEIISNNDSSQTTEIVLAGESPIIITQTSPDGIFSPIKSRSCTITIISKETYFDMYSGSSHGTSVTVNNLTQGECMFFGYLTPCEYNQPYLYLNEIELEAVDAVSTLQDFKYQYQNGYTSKLVSIKSVLQYCLNRIGGYKGGVYVPKDGLRMKKAVENGYSPTEMEFISEEAFIDDNDSMTCYEVLEEICNFYNVSLVPYGNDVYLIDYELVSQHGVNNSDYILFNNITENYDSQEYIPASIQKDDYCGDDQNIEMDEVYNKVSVKVETKEITDEDLMYDPMNDINGSTYFYTIQSGMDRSDGVKWTHVTRLFEFIKGSYGGWSDSNGDWQTLCNTNSAFESFGYKLTDNFSNSEVSNTYGWMEFPYTTGYLFNKIVGQTCMPAQQFGYESTKEMPYNSNWSNTLLFFPQVQWINEYYKQNGGFTVPKDYTTVLECWKDFYENHLGGSIPVLIYSGKKDIQFSPTDSSKTNYIAFTGDLLWQQNCTYDDVRYHIWSVDTDDNKHYYGGTIFPIKDAGAHDTHNAYSRGTGDSNFNKGWNMLKIKLSIGDRYWNGSSWQDTECVAWIPYHKENVVNEEERLIWSDYNKPVTNHNYTYKIGKDAYAIPITKADGLHGKIKFQVYMPMIPYSNDLFDDWDGGNRISQGTVINNIDFYKTPTVIFMKNLSLELISADNDREHWYMDFSDIDKKDDDIIYSNEINNQNITEFDDLTLKINTYNAQEPISQSYIIEPTQYNVTNWNISNITKSQYHNDGFYRVLKNTYLQEEMNVVNRYVEHYTNPKKIYNCEVHGYYKPWNNISVSALNNLEMVVDEQEYDVKADTNELKLIEY